MRITLPSNSLIVLCGPAGSGKSTFAVRHFKSTQIVSSDECRAMISDDPTNQRVSGHAFHLMHFILRKRLHLGRLTVADATHLEKAHRRQLISMARAFGVKVVAIIFDVPLELCLERNASRLRSIPEDAIATQHELLRQSLRSIEEEGFDKVFILREEDQDRARVVVSKRS